MIQAITFVELKMKLNYCPLSGDFTWKFNNKKIQKGKIAGTIKTDKKGYKVKNIMINGKLYVAARLAWFYMTGEWPNQVDHENHNSIDNKWKNLRNVSSMGNNRNRSLSKRNKSGVIGVNFVQGKWIATICANYNMMVLYRGDDFNKACAVRTAANEEYGFHENHGKKMPLEQLRTRG